MITYFWELRPYGFFSNPIQCGHMLNPDTYIIVEFYLYRLTLFIRSFKQKNKGFQTKNMRIFVAAIMLNANFWYFLLRLEFLAHDFIFAFQRIPSLL